MKAKMCNITVCCCTHQFLSRLLMLYQSNDRLLIIPVKRSFADVISLRRLRWEYCATSICVVTWQTSNVSLSGEIGYYEVQPQHLGKYRQSLMYMIACYFSLVLIVASFHWMEGSMLMRYPSKLYIVWRCIMSLMWNYMPMLSSIYSR